MGVYAIVNLKTDFRYIGSSKCLTKRHSEHRKALLSNKHFNEDLQKDFNEYGKLYFTFTLVEEVFDIEMLRERERWYILNTKDVYNQSIPSDGIGTISHSQRTKDKLRDISIQKELEDPEKFKQARERSANTIREKVKNGEWACNNVGIKNNPTTSKPIICTNGDITVEYPSIAEAARQLGLVANKIQDVLYGFKNVPKNTKKGRVVYRRAVRHHKGWVFKYK